MAGRSSRAGGPALPAALRPVLYLAGGCAQVQLSGGEVRGLANKPWPWQ